MPTLHRPDENGQLSERSARQLLAELDPHYCRRQTPAQRRRASRALLAAARERIAEIDRDGYAPEDSSRRFLERIVARHTRELRERRTGATAPRARQDCVGGNTRPAHRSPSSTRGSPSSGGDDPDLGGDDPEGERRPVAILAGRSRLLLDSPACSPSFAAWHATLPTWLAGPARLAAFARLPENVQASLWRELAVTVDRGRAA